MSEPRILCNSRARPVISSILGLLTLFCFSSPAAVAQNATNLSASNVATRIGNGFWQWTAFIQGPPETLRQVKCVRYTLHPTFPNPIRDVCSRGNGPRAFPLTTSGWGTFPLKIHVLFANGKTTDLILNLKF